MRSTVDKKKLEQLYDSYRDPQDENKIGIDGIQQFCDDLNLDPASVSVLVIAWKFRAATQCEFSKKEFVDGMTELGCDSTEKLRALLPRLEQELKDTVKFKDFYQFTFTFAKNPGQKGLGERKIHIRRKPHLHETDSGYNQPVDSWVREANNQCQQCYQPGVWSANGVAGTSQVT
ncbi:hypothetical protein GH733_006464 [Mirounga leonina]|nr:hypothetical protein GH733_006464 [Mirounga leonina]